MKKNHKLIRQDKILDKIKEKARRVATVTQRAKKRHSTCKCDACTCALVTGRSFGISVPS